MYNQKEDSKILKKGLLWQQNDNRKSLKNIFKEKWKQRFFILTNHYLACFKKAKNQFSEMGLFLFKLSFNDIKSIAIVNDCIHINDDFIILWDKDNRLLTEWLNCLNDVKNKCFERSNFVYKKSNLVLDGNKNLNRPASLLCVFTREMSPSSGLTPDINFNHINRPSSSRFDYSGSYEYKPFPFFLSVSPSLNQKSIYGQKILSPNSTNPKSYSKIFRHFNKPFFSPNISSSFSLISFFNQLNQPKLSNQSKLKSAASEFSFISINGHQQTFENTINSENNKKCSEISQPLVLSPPQSLKSSQSSLQLQSKQPIMPPHQRQVTIKSRLRPWSCYIEKFYDLDYSSDFSQVSLTSNNDCNQITHEQLFVKLGQKSKTRMDKIIENSSKNFT